MFIYLLGDVLRLYSGDVQIGNLFGEKTSQLMFLGIAIFMSIPVLMILITLLSNQSISRCANIIAAGFLLIVNLIGIPSYKSWYDIFLIVVSLGINCFTIYYAWNWN